MQSQMSRNARRFIEQRAAKERRDMIMGIVLALISAPVIFAGIVGLALNLARF